MYVTLEPCSHQGQTPPCADAIIKAGIARVVSALEDPNPEVAGQGPCAVAREGHRRRYRPRRRRGAPRPCRPHHARHQRSAARDAEAGGVGRRQGGLGRRASRRRSPAKRRWTRVFQMRAASDAIMVGIGTVLSDNPQLTCRLPGMFERSPVRVVLDAGLKLPLMTSVVATVRETPTWVFTSRKRVGDRRGNSSSRRAARCSASAMRTASSIWLRCSRFWPSRASPG